MNRDLSSIVNFSETLSVLGVPHVLGDDEADIRRSLVKMSQGYSIPEGPMKGELFVLSLNETEANAAAPHLQIVSGRPVPRLVMKMADR